VCGSTNERDKETKKRGRESFLIAWSETCLITLLRTDLILTPHPSRLTFHVLSISRLVAGSWLSGFYGLSRVCGSTNERDKAAPRIR